jgi:hypothetical protein
VTKQHYVLLSVAERERLDRIIHRRSSAASTRLHARILLLCDTSQGGGNRTDRQVAAAVHCSSRQVARVRALFAARGLDAALERKARSRNTPRLLDEVQTAQVIELALSPAPGGRDHWSVRLLAEEIVAQGIAPAIGRETVRQTLKRGAVRPM